MHIRARFAVLVPLAALLFATASDRGPTVEGPLQQRQKAQKLVGDGNFKEAYDVYRGLVLSPATEPRHVGSDLHQAMHCLQRVNREKETDELREAAVEAHPKHWRLLSSVAQSYYQANHHGYIIAGEFERGHHRGGGKYVNCTERDRIRALQLMEQALAHTGDEDDNGDLAGFHLQFARILLGYRGHAEAWRLQYLGDLSVLPDYEENRWHGHGYNPAQGAPVDVEGQPVFHSRPDTYADAATDGERWRWMLDRAMELVPTMKDQVLTDFARFHYNQFGVQTLSSYGALFRRVEEDGADRDESGTYALHTLQETETIARLATGIKRFDIPDEFSFVRIFQGIADGSKSSYAEQALNTLAQLFENRRQYKRAVDYWERSIEEHGPGHDKWKEKRLRQIVENWGRFEPLVTHPAGEDATVEYRFRNGSHVEFTAHELDVRLLLRDVKQYLESNPGKLEWDRLNLGQIGFRIVEKGQDKYVGKEVASWGVKLEPRSNHFDERITIRTPLKKAGAYLLTARMKGGNTSKIIVWLDDTVIVRKQLDKKAYFFVADAVTGRPLEKVNVEFFGYKQERENTKLTPRRYKVVTSRFAEFTDADGQIQPRQDDLKQNFQWLLSATTEAGRLAFLGFSNVWYGNYYDQQYNQTKVYTITDRPVYRPAQPVSFKFWVRQAKYDQEDVSAHAGQSFAVRIQNPKGEKVFEKTFKADAYGGFDGLYDLPADAALGQYSIHIPGRGGGSFRVEEYKKPEFEVTVDAPSDPVMLGETIEATIRAKYYFGSPVVKAKVKYKIMRTDHSAEWYPPAPWDWFYGPGYWWFAYDYDWYPGWGLWGCRRPTPSWWHRSHQPPELVAEREVEIGPDGTVEVEIDTTLAKELHGDTDHRYEITAEVVDESRRTIVGKGTVLVARRPFKVYAWVDRGHYRVGDVVRAEFSARTLDSKPVEGEGQLLLYRLTYKDGEPEETVVEEWDLDTDDQGRATLQLKAGKAGQYRLSYRVTDAAEHCIEGGYLFVVRGDATDPGGYRFSHIELVPDKREYEPGETVRLAVNTDRPDSTVVLFLRPANGVCLPPRVLRLTGKTKEVEIPVTKKDMPNFFVEAFTVSGGRYYQEMREIVVPPDKRVLNVEVSPSADAYLPGEKATLKVKLTDRHGQPFTGSTVLTMYDRAVEYISGGSNVPEIRAFFWKWRRQHNPWAEHSLARRFNARLPKGQVAMQNLGVFGHLVPEETDKISGARGESEFKRKGGAVQRMTQALGFSASVAAPMAAKSMVAADAMVMEEDAEGGAIGNRADGSGGGGGADPMAAPVVRTKFADTAFWVGALATDTNGEAEVTLDMPENLTGWKVRAWAMGHGTSVGEGTVEVVTRKNLMLRLQAPRFFVEKDEVVLSANVHNYLDADKQVRAVLELDGPCLEAMGDASVTVTVEAGGEKRVDWRVKVVREGEAIIRMKALTDEESDAMQMTFPVYVHGMLKTDSYSGVIRPDGTDSSFRIDVPAERRIEQSRLEIRYSPTLAGAMVDALPYLVEYPYGCTEQTLNRFLPTVITQKILREMGLDLAAIQAKRTNLNAQEIGDDAERARQWKRWKRNPVFDEETVEDMVKKGLQRLTAMQLSDGGWGWFSGWGERSYPHTTAVVVHGLQIARDNDVAIVPGVVERGVDWLLRYQKAEVRELKNAAKKKRPWKSHADNLDALVHMVLTDEGKDNDEMREFLYRDRTHLAVYAKAMTALAMHRGGHVEERDMLMRNIEQVLVLDDENQTAYLELGNGGYWWSWYGSEYEAHAYYLKLLAATNPKGDVASRLVKYLLNNRKHATYWKSTRDTAVCVEAMADYLRASGEDKPDMTIEVQYDGEKRKEVRVTAENLFSFDNAFVLEGKAVTAGGHDVRLIRHGKGPVYYNAYLTNFTLEDFITRAGLEIKVNRQFYKLKRVEKSVKVAGSRGQAVDQRVEKYEREPIENLQMLKSGDLVEVELVIESKNDYEYIVFEDMKAAGFEPVDVRSGYRGNDGLGAYVEFRDERVAFFVRRLARGKHSMAYRLRAEIPGRFSALPTRAYAMYAPELRANSDEIKLQIED